MASVQAEAGRHAARFYGHNLDAVCKIQFKSLQNRAPRPYPKNPCGMDMF